MIRKTRKQPKCSSADEWIKKVWYVHNGILLSCKKECSNTICSNRDTTRDYHNEWNKSKTNIMWYHFYVQSKTWHKWACLQNSSLADTERGLKVAKGEGTGGGTEWEVGISRCKQVSTGRINDKVLLYGTGNDIQYSVINHNRKDTKKNIYICMTESLHCTAEYHIVSQLCFDFLKVSLHL